MSFRSRSVNKKLVNSVQNTSGAELAPNSDVFANRDDAVSTISKVLSKAGYDVTSLYD
jgi:hypothetical protein